MLELPLTKAEEEAFDEALRASHRIAIDVSILNAREKPIGSATFPEQAVVEGSVAVDVESDGVDRILSLTLLDPKRRLAFTPEHPGQAGLYVDNFIRVVYCVFVEPLDRWVRTPVFHGPLTSFEHAGETVTVEAQGKEALLLIPHIVLQGYTIRKGTRIDDAIKRVLRHGGERRFDIPRIKRKLTSDVVVRPGDEPWRVIQGGGEFGRQGLIDRTGGRAHQLYFTARGRPRLRRARKARVRTFTKRDLLSKPVMTWEMVDFRNFIRVNGGKPKGSHHAVQGEAALPRNHPLSAQSLRDEGEPRWMSEIIEADNLRTRKECEDRADDLLQRHSDGALTASFDCLPEPRLEPLDKIAADTPEGRVEFLAKSFTIPLTAGASMSVNFNKRIRQRRARRRNR